MVTRMLWLTARLAIVGLVIGTSILVATSPNGLYLLPTLPYAVTGAVLVIRRPRTSIGWILIGLGAGFALISMPVTATPQQFADGSVDLPVAVFAIIHSGLGTTLMFLYAVLVMVFPSGRLPMGRWGRLGWVGLGVGLVFAAAAYVMPEISAGYPASLWVPNPIAVLPDLSIWRVMTPMTVVFPVMILWIAGAVSLVVRVRRAAGTERQQLRWIAASFAVLMSAVVSGFVIASLVPDSDIGLAWIPATVAFPTVPIAIGIAVLRYRLYDIDRIISRTISYGVVTAMLVAVYAGSILVLQGPLGAITGGDTVAVAASTLAAAALFQPVRRRTQAAVDHRFNRARYDAERTIDALAARLRDEMDLPIVRSAVVDAVARSVEPTAASLWLRSGRLS
jgi:hypothetical protein